MNTPVCIPLYIPLNEEGLDDLFVFKHKYEEINNIKEHILYTDFIKHMHVGECAFHDAKTNETIGFTMTTIDDVVYIIHTPSTEDALKNFKEEMENAKLVPEKLPKVDLRKVVEEPVTGSFFVIDDEMHPVV